MEVLKLTINEMKRMNEEVGQHWFSEGAMNIFNTRIEAGPNKENIFITSDAMDPDAERRYTLRLFGAKTSKVDTIGEFQEFATLEEAKKARKEISKKMGVFTTEDMLHAMLKENEEVKDIFKKNFLKE